MEKGVWLGSPRSIQREGQRGQHTYLRGGRGARREMLGTLGGHGCQSLKGVPCPMMWNRAWEQVTRLGGWKGNERGQLQKKAKFQSAVGGGGWEEGRDRAPWAQMKILGQLEKVLIWEDQLEKCAFFFASRKRHPILRKMQSCTPCLGKWIQGWIQPSFTPAPSVFEQSTIYRVGTWCFWAGTHSVKCSLENMDGAGNDQVVKSRKGVKRVTERCLKRNLCNFLGRKDAPCSSPLPHLRPSCLHLWISELLRRRHPCVRLIRVLWEELCPLQIDTLKS